MRNKQTNVIYLLLKCKPVSRLVARWDSHAFNWRGARRMKKRKSWKRKRELSKTHDFTSAILVTQVRKPPYITEANRKSNKGENEIKFSYPSFACFH